MSSDFNKTPSPLAGEGWGEGAHQNDFPSSPDEVFTVRKISLIYPDCRFV